MEGFSPVIWAISAAILTILLLKKWMNGGSSSMLRLPPGPPAWPVVGNIFDLGTMPHQNLYRLRPKYGPVLWLKLGSVDTMVIQSAKSAADLFKNHDLAFSNRTVPDAMTAWSFNQGSLGFAPYGTYWRILRKICSTEFLVNRQLNNSFELREKCVDKLVDWIEEEATASRDRGGSGEVEPTHLLFLMSFNLVGNLMLSRDLLNVKSKEGHDFFKAVNMVMQRAGKPNVADFFPLLKWIDPQSIRRNMRKDLGTAINIVASFVKHRVQENKTGREKVKKDFLDMLLEYERDGKEGPKSISEKNITFIIVEMFVAGSETTSVTVEWALAELLRCPQFMRKARDELDKVIGATRKIKESDIDKLPYLQAVVKETLRLHPAVPLLVPRCCREDTKYMNYLIPINTQVFVNAWAIGRDSDTWENPLCFDPQRFFGSSIDYKGQDFEFIPFGSGRRICVGMDLAHRVVHLSLATLLLTFDWELDIPLTPETLDMTERMGITLRKLVPLRAIPKKRKIL
ncbi:Iridoid oxidase [Heracleum sosnowskyi]|uniref:Iridoid oxidase n=1 Tax=Heracleum sosnowskyi TaxID=360622 RepID=A0AAD8IFS7_9APIA|nr:Iridoid oxidase [Heracleum sosnowskyi]